MNPLRYCPTHACKSLQVTGTACTLWAAALVLAAGANAQMAETARLQPNDLTAGDRFGYSVSVLGERALIGAPQKHVGGDAGAVYVFERNGAGTWSPIIRLQASDRTAGDNFGTSVELSDRRAIVGARGVNKAYMFERDNDGMWAEVGILDAGGGGCVGAVALSGDRAVAGACAEDDARGAVYVYERDSGGTWTMAARLQASRVDRSVFGRSVAIDGDLMVVGAVGEDDYAGAAYVFDRDDAGAWIEVARLVASARGPQEEFGVSVALSGNRAIVGHPGRHAAYVFEPDGLGVWKQVSALEQTVLESFRLGRAVGLSDDRALVGGAEFGKSAVYVFDREDGGAWSEVGNLVAQPVQDGAEFGGSVSVSSGVVLVGAASEDTGGNDAGAAYVFETVQVGTNETLELPTNFSLSQNYPNPFNPTTTISYELPEIADVTLTVYDLLGRTVRELASGTQPAGSYEVSFDAAVLPSGVYCYRLTAGDFVEARRMVVVK